MRGFYVFDEDSSLGSFVRRQSSRLVKFYTLESETNKCVFISEPGYGFIVLKNGKSDARKHAQLCSMGKVGHKSPWGGYHLTHG